MSKGFLIAIEGIDGSGKTTQTDLLRNFLQSEGKKTFVSGEPTNSVIGLFVRNLIKGEGFLADDVDPLHFQKVLSYLFHADRIVHVHGRHLGILELLRQGFVVIVPRYIYSSLAYNAQSQGDIFWLRELFDRDIKLLPHIVIYLDLPPNIAIKRIKNRQGKDMFEDEFSLKNIYQRYQSIFSQQFETPVIKIDATKPAIANSREICSIVKQYLP